MSGICELRLATSGRAALLIGLCAMAWACRRDEPATTPNGTERATLVITTEVYTGDTDTTVEFRRGAAVAKSKVRHSYNVPTGQESFSGDFHEVYTAVTGQTHPEPATLCQAESILQAVQSAGWSITEDAEKEQGDRPSVPATIRTIRLERKP